MKLRLLPLLLIPAMPLNAAETVGFAPPVSSVDQSAASRFAEQTRAEVLARFPGGGPAVAEDYGCD